MFRGVLVFWICLLIIVATYYMRILLRTYRKVKIPVLKYSSNQKNDINTVRNTEFSQAPGPFPWPVIGNILTLARYSMAFEAFTELSREYGDAYSLTLGTTRCFVVNNLELIREVLNQNGKFFGGRPNFLRYRYLFGGDRNNSLALCDWSRLQQKRRNLARRYCSPRDFSSFFEKMSSVGCSEIKEFMNKIGSTIVTGEEFYLKPIIQRTCANIFIQYMCSQRFDYDDPEFIASVECFDEIFWDINQGYALDFLPWLAPFYKGHLRQIVKWSTTIRKFILNRIMKDREKNLLIDGPETDFADALLRSLATDKNVSRETIIFMLEDFIGGHSAVGNLVMLALVYIAKNSYVGTKIQEEIDKNTETSTEEITLHHMNKMPYTVATIFEVLRCSSSPIVPHVATEDAVISGHGITSGTIVFINNYKLNTSKQYWTNPEIFSPERFLEEISTPIFQKESCNETYLKVPTTEGYDSGIEFEKDLEKLKHVSCTTPDSKNLNVKKIIQLKKNFPHFIPFSIGKRTCIGQTLVRGFGFILLANILRRYSISSRNPDCIKISPACVALPSKTYPLILNERSK